MSHLWNCPTDWEARGRARDDAEFDLRYGGGRYDYRNPYDCDEANDAYQREYRREAERLEEERAMERAAERRREEARQEEEYWMRQAEQEAQQRADEDAYWAEQEEMALQSAQAVGEFAAALSPNQSDAEGVDK